MGLRRREDLKAADGVDLARLARRGGTSAGFVVLVIAVAVLVLLLSVRFRAQVDLSSARINVLSPQSMEVLERLEQPVTLYPLMGRMAPQREEYWTRLKLYREASDKVGVEFIDPVSQPGRVQALELSADQQGFVATGTTVAVSGERKILFRGIDEESISNALLELSSNERRVVGFIRGYGERDPGSDHPIGFGGAARALQQEYYELVDVRLGDGIPADVDVLIAAGPRIALPPQDRAAIGAWLQGGGRLLLLLDPEMGTQLNEVLSPWGLAATGEQVSDNRFNYGRDESYIQVRNYSGHPIVDGFGANLPSYFPGVGRVEHFEPGDPLVFHQDLLLSSDVSKTVTDGRLSGGPFTVGAASWRREPGSEQETRVVLVGDSEFAANRYLQQGANRNLFLNCVGWLAREQSLVSIRSSSLEAQELRFEPGDFLWVRLVCYGAPLIVLIAGITVYFRRRRL